MYNIFNKIDSLVCA